MLINMLFQAHLLSLLLQPPPPPPQPFSTHINRYTLLILYTPLRVSSFIMRRHEGTPSQMHLKKKNQTKLVRAQIVFCFCLTSANDRRQRLQQSADEYSCCSDIIIYYQDGPSEKKTQILCIKSSGKLYYYHICIYKHMSMCVCMCVYCLMSELILY